MESIYKVVLTSPRVVYIDDKNGNPVETTFPIGTVINTIIWDGVTPYKPDDDCELVKV